jgi:HEAT repeats/Biotin-requiring enzyme
MSNVGHDPDGAASPGEPQLAKPGGLPRRWLLGILILAFLFVLMPFLFWRATWFGQPLTDEGLTRNLADAQHPRKAQHALSQLADRILNRDPAVRSSARRWYPNVIALASGSHVELRVTAAWVMGQDNQEPRFQSALRKLLEDPNPMVRRNAALALVRFGDDSGRETIRGLLLSYPEQATAIGTLRQRLKPGDTVNPGTLLARIESAGMKVEVRATVPGTLARWLVNDGVAVSPGAPIAGIDPSADEEWEALRALYLIGKPEDLPVVEGLLRSRGVVTDAVRRQAELTARAIRGRYPQ